MATFVLLLSQVVMLTGLSQATTPPQPSLKYLYTGNATLQAPLEVGPGPWGNRRVYGIASGVFAGPMLKGTITSMGGDWSLWTANETVINADIRLTLKTHDGAYIQVFETGVSQSDGTLHLRATYETGSKKYYWLNSVVAVAILKILSMDDGTLTYDAWQLCGPGGTTCA
ncbi:hypothetical protein GQ53DRAFT_815643 [Thozetella sp. PMI_491]|nr:hypothetical protein GQ53DRAFT_815643 [Thozetella sp. PMI_491]